MRTSLPPDLCAIAVKQLGLVTASQCEAAGIGRQSRSRRVTSGHWLRVGRGCYLVAGVVPEPPEPSALWALHHGRQVLATLLNAPADAVPIGLTALAVHGVWGLPWDLGGQVCYGGRHSEGSTGFRVRQFANFDTTVVAGRVVPTVRAALIHALPEVGRDLAVVLLDSALNRGLLQPEELDLIRDGVRGRRGAASLRDVWALVDGRAESPIETRSRLECVDAGLRVTDLQVELFDSAGRFLARGDIGFRSKSGAWVIAEIDGVEEHGTLRALHHDRVRQNDIALLTETTLLRFSGADLGTGRIPRTIARALMSQGGAEPLVA